MSIIVITLFSPGKILGLSFHVSTNLYCIFNFLIDGHFEVDHYYENIVKIEVFIFAYLLFSTFSSLIKM